MRNTITDNDKITTNVIFDKIYKFTFLEHWKMASIKTDPVLNKAEKISTIAINCSDLGRKTTLKTQMPAINKLIAI